MRGFGNVAHIFWKVISVYSPFQNATFNPHFTVMRVTKENVRGEQAMIQELVKKALGYVRICPETTVKTPTETIPYHECNVAQESGCGICQMPNTWQSYAATTKNAKTIFSLLWRVHLHFFYEKVTQK